MPKCVVCRADYKTGRLCPNCQSDNATWEIWQEKRPEEQGGLLGILHFTEPLCHMPLVITAAAPVLGLMCSAVLWRAIRLSICLLAVTMTVCGCSFALRSVYRRRLRIREASLLATVCAGWRKHLLVLQVKPLLVLALSIALFLSLTSLLVESDLWWRVASSVLLDPHCLEQAKQGSVGAPPVTRSNILREDEDFLERVIDALPLISMIGYVTLGVSSVYSSSLELALAYARQIGKVVPSPVFLRGNLLVAIVTRDTKRALRRRIIPKLVERTANGGVRLTVAIRAEDEIVHRGTGRLTDPLTTCTVKTDPWGRIVKIDGLPKLTDDSRSNSRSSRILNRTHPLLLSLSQDRGNLSSRQPLPGRGNGWAVLVGVDTYEDLENYDRLQVCVRDARVIRWRLLAGGWDTNCIRLLTDYTDICSDRGHILSALEAIAGAAEPDDLVLFYFSGHGDTEGGEPYLVAHDSWRVALRDTAVPVSQIKETMQQSNARAKIIVLDSCHSGSDGGSRKVEPRLLGFIESALKQSGGLAILTSCGESQLSYEWRDSGNSVFTHFLVEALEGRADWDRKGFITVREAYRYVADEVRMWGLHSGHTQTPTLAYEGEGDIVLLRY